MKVAEQSSSQCLATMALSQLSVWNGRHSLTQQSPLVGLIIILGSLFIFPSNKHFNPLNFFFLLEGHLSVMGVYQSFEDNPTSAWCSLPEGPSFLAVRLDKRPTVGSSHTLATLYRWQGVLVAVEVGSRQDCPSKTKH